MRRKLKREGNSNEKHDREEYTQARITSQQHKYNNWIIRESRVL
jgi:hypothetical protein